MKKQHSGRALVRGGAARSLTLIVEMGIGIFLTPFLVHNLGDERYGAWLLIGSLTGMYGMLDLGLTQAVSRYVSRAHGMADPALASRYVTASFYLFSAMGLFLVALGCALAPFSAHMADGEIGRELPMLFAVTSIALGLSFPARTFMGVLTAHLRYDQMSLARMFTAILRAWITIWLVERGYGLLSLTLLAAITNLLRLGTLWWHSNREGERLVLTRHPEFKNDAKVLLGYGGVSFLSQLADIIRTKMSPVIVSQTLSLAQATPFGIAQRLSQIYGRGMQALVATTLPVFSRLEAQSDPKKYLAPYLLIYKISCYFAIFGAGCVWLFVEPFITRWMGPDYAHAAGITKILMIGTLCGAMQLPSINLLFGTSKHGFYAKSNWIEAVILLVLSVIWASKYGLPGIAYAYTTAMVISKFGLQPWGAARVLEIPVLQYHLRGTLPNTLKAALFTAPMVWLVAPLTEPKYATIFLGTIACGLLFCGYIYLVGFDRAEREKLRNAIYKRKRKTSPS